jgi:hypothetical protein
MLPRLSPALGILCGSASGFVVKVRKDAPLEPLKPFACGGGRGAQPAGTCVLRMPQ